jgi:hypothetical protein
MPKRKPDFDSQSPNETGDRDYAREHKNRKNRVIVPLTENGELDTERVKDVAELDKARAALGLAKGSIADTEVEIPKLPRQLVPPLYDGIAYLIRGLVKLARWPRVMTPDERNVFVGFMSYTDEFKRDATEPTAALIDQYVGRSRWVAWCMEHKDAAMVTTLFGQATYNMFVGAAMQFNQWRQVEAAKVKANGGFPPSENRIVDEAVNP